MLIDFSFFCFTRVNFYSFTHPLSRIINLFFQTGPGEEGGPGEEANSGEESPGDGEEDGQEDGQEGRSGQVDGENRGLVQVVR